MPNYQLACNQYRFLRYYYVLSLQYVVSIARLQDISIWAVRALRFKCRVATGGFCKGQPRFQSILSFKRETEDLRDLFGGFPMKKLFPFWETVVTRFSLTRGHLGNSASKTEGLLTWGRNPLRPVYLSTEFLTRWFQEMLTSPPLNAFQVNHWCA